MISLPRVSERRTRGKIVIWLIGLIFAATLAGFAVAARMWLRPLGDLDQGLAAYKQGDWTTADRIARKCLLADPNDIAALRLLARSTARLGRDELVQTLYSRVKADDREPEDHLLIGRLIERMGDVNLAIRTWQLGITGDPDHPEILEALIKADRRAGFLEAAAELSERLARRPESKVCANVWLGDLKAELNDPASAVPAYQRALESFDQAAPDDKIDTRVVIAKKLARVWLRAGKHVEARATLDSVGLSPGRDLEGDWLHARAAIQAGDMSAAHHVRAAEYRIANPAEPEPAPYVGAAS